MKGGGSGDGIAALLHGMVDIGMTSRDLSRRERDYAVSKDIEILGIRAGARRHHGHRQSRQRGRRAWTSRQLQDIFAGKIRNWRELEGGEGGDRRLRPRGGLRNRIAVRRTRPGRGYLCRIRSAPADQRGHRGRGRGAAGRDRLYRSRRVAERRRPGQGRRASRRSAIGAGRADIRNDPVGRTIR